MTVLFAIVFATLLLVADPATAAPVAAALTTFFTTAGFSATFAATLATFVVRTAVGIAFSLVGQLFAKKPKVQPQGIQTEQTTSGDTTPQKFVVGRYALDGHAVAPAYSHGPDNTYLTYILEVSNIPVNGLTGRVAIDGQWYDYDTENPHADYGFPFPELFNAGHDRGWIKFYDGTQTEADPMLVDKYGEHFERPWTNDHVLQDSAYAVLTFRLDREVFSGLPAVRFEVDGINLYDPRKDTTVGGSGAHRWADPATWEFTRNPQVINYNILRGITMPSGDIYGGQVSPEDLPLASWFAAMNECDGLIGERTRYEAGFEIDVSVEPFDVIQEMNRASFTQISEFGGVFVPRTGPPAAPVLSMTDADIVITQPEDLEPFPGLAGTNNAISGIYLEPNDVWQGREADPIYNAQWEAEDGDRRLTLEMNLPAVSDKSQAQHLLNSYINDERRFSVHRLVLHSRFAVLEPLDTISWTSAYNGYTAKVFEVVELEDHLDTMLQFLTIREREAADVEWSASDDVPAPAPVLGVESLTPAVPSLGVVAYPVQDGESNDRRPGIRITWSEDDAGSNQALIYQVRINGSSELVANGTVDVGEEKAQITEGLLPGETYEVRARFVSGNGPAWSNWVEVTAPNIRPGLEDLDDAVSQAIDDAAESADADKAAAEAAAVAADAAKIDAEAAQTLSEAAQAGSEAAQTASEAAQAAAETARDGAGVFEASAADHASDAGGYSAEAQAAQAVAVQTAAQTMPSNFRRDGTYWSGSANSNPNSPGALHANVSFADVTQGRVARWAASPASNVVIANREVLQPRAGAKYRVYVRARQIAGTLGRTEFRTLVRSLTGAYANSTQSSTPHVFGALNTFDTLFTDVTMPDPLTDQVYIRAAAFTPSGGNAGDQFEVLFIRLEDITGETLAEGHASAAATSASAASASETAAESSAAAAETDRIAAQAARADADGFASAASTSAGTASAAATEAGDFADASEADRILAQTARDDADGFATAASNSATAASASSTEAGDFADAAEGDRILAQSARDDADGFASAASSSAGTASAASTAAGDFADAAEGHATNAETSRAQAETAAVNASSAQTDAETAQAAAEAAQAVAARVFHQSAYDNPLFQRWSGTYPDGVIGVGLGSTGSITQVTGKFTDTAMQVATGGSPQDLQPRFRIGGVTAETTLPPAEEVEKLHVIADLTLIAGKWSGTKFRARWIANGSGGSNAVQDIFLEDVLNRELQDIPQAFEAVFTKPDGYVAGSEAGYVDVFFYGTSTGGSATGAVFASTTRIDRLDVKALAGSATASIVQQVKATQDSQSALLALRAKAGGAVGEVEVAAFDDPEGDPASQILLTADAIRFNSDLAVFENGIVASDNYAEDGSGNPTDGFQFDGPNGTIKGKSVITQELIAPEAVIKQGITQSPSANYFSDASYSVIAQGPSMEFDPYDAFPSPRAYARNPIMAVVYGTAWAATSSDTQLYIAFEGRIDSGNPWTTITGMIARVYLYDERRQNFYVEAIDPAGFGAASSDYTQIRAVAITTSSGDHPGVGAYVSGPTIRLVQINR